jgi:hypothetical protein
MSLIRALAIFAISMAAAIPFCVMAGSLKSIGVRIF